MICYSGSTASAVSTAGTPGFYGFLQFATNLVATRVATKLLALRKLHAKKLG
jgi:hypothetical protein